MTQERLEMRANIKFCMNLGKSATETFTMLQQAKGKDSVCRALVFRWHKKFFEGHTALNDEHRSGRKKSVKASSVASIQSALDTDRRLTVRELAEIADVSVGTAHRILTKDLNMRKVSK